jgi:hypothetical protein
MKLLHDFYRLHFAGLRAAPVRRGTGLPEFSVTVPLPLEARADEHVACATHESVRVPRPEPASFLKSSRHRRRRTAR